jgi:hypothetical protein
MRRQNEFERLCRQIGLVFASAGLTPKVVLATLSEARERIYDRRYGLGTNDISVDKRGQARKP